jgi:hypothetical protein
MTFLILAFIHLLSDYPLQGEFLATMKGKNLIALVSHAGIWTGMISFTVFALGFHVTLIDVISLFVVHAVADYLKAKPVGIYKKLNSLKGGLLLDQSIHILQILVLMYYKGMF